jgi:TRAP-type C4-dicarboxylate transport system permease small subunit
MVKDVLAQGVVNLRPGQGEFVALENLTFGQVVSAAIVLILVIAAIVFFFILIVGGIRWITSGGDKAQTEAARNQITAALVGLVIVFAAWAIVQLIQWFFGIDILSGLAIPTVSNF